MKIQKAFNDSMGFDSISLFVTIDHSYAYDMKDLEVNLQKIEESGVKDLIFDGNLMGNMNFLRWFTSLFIAEDYSVTLALNLLQLYEGGMIVRMFAHRTVILVGELFRKWSGVLDMLGKRDVLLIKHPDINILRRVTQQVVDRNNEAWVYFDERMLSREKVLNSELLNVYPYRGEL